MLPFWFHMLLGLEPPCVPIPGSGGMRLGGKFLSLLTVGAVFVRFFPFPTVCGNPKRHTDQPFPPHTLRKTPEDSNMTH